jgi:methylated-DNA-protein-cysteine methyltransferase related protein
MDPPPSSSAYPDIYKVVRRIPPGHVATYGQVAILAGLPGRARQVGYALHALRPSRDQGVPWHRVINARGEISARSGNSARSGAGLEEHTQRQLLEAEGVTFNAQGRVDLHRHQWR